MYHLTVFWFAVAGLAALIGYVVGRIHGASALQHKLRGGRS